MILNLQAVSPPSMGDKTETAWVMRHMKVSGLVMMLLGVMMVGGGGWVVWNSVTRSK